MERIKNKNILIILTSFFIISILFNIKYNVIFINIINPIFWIGIITYYVYNKIYLRFRQKNKYYLYSTIVSFLYITVYFLLGIYFGFAKSPYNHHISSIIKNIYIQIIPIIGIELARTIIIIKNKENKKIIYLATIILILLEINYKTLIDTFQNKEEFFKYTCQIIIPTIINGMLYSYLTIKTRYITSLVYRVNTKLVTLLAPILPNLDWFVSSSVEILAPTIIYLMYKYGFVKQREDTRHKKQNASYKINYIITIILSSLLICFMTGIFKYEPITILSNSMTPVITKGDVVIYKRLTTEQIKELPINAIILYTKQDRNIVHRIVKKIENGNNILFETKGDNNNKPDVELVKIEEIKGAYEFHIKYIGYPSVWLKYYFSL